MIAAADLAISPTDGTALRSGGRHHAEHDRAARVDELADAVQVRGHQGRNVERHRLK